MLNLHSGPPVLLTAPGGTAGITVETLQMQKKKNRLMEEAKKNGRASKSVPPFEMCFLAALRLSETKPAELLTRCLTPGGDC